MRVKVGDVYLNFVVEGEEGIPLLLVHGFPFDHTMWRAQLSGLADHFRMIAPDLRGFGESDAPEGGYSMDRFADDLAGLLDVLGVEKVVLVGLSMGGYIAFAFQRRHPERLSGLVLVDTQATADTLEGREGRFAAIEKVRRQGVESIVDGLLPKLFAPMTLLQKPIAVRSLREMMARQPANGVIGALEAMAGRPDSTPGLEGITCKSLVVVGQEDALTPPAKAEAMASAIKAARLQIVPGAGHLVPIEAPEAFNNLLHNGVSVF